ncbi:MAG: bifunctional proline dehydrogenase/L-glutamate gamma-semialdehyde dehydrogenase PutA [Woeseiaceae bacterium]|nr:bifunctional proline dehydrogenase/L-glutamate gamma-semialdehyde dehydrogenase PutA [Woeseiaceae bacterium]
MQISQQPAGRPGPIPYVNDHYLTDEEALVRELTEQADPGEEMRRKIEETASTLVRAVRRAKANEGGIEAFLQEYDLSSEEGVLLMCIAEALLRIPDAETADELIADKLTAAHFERHMGESDSLFVNAGTWGLMLTGRILQLDEMTRGNPLHLLGTLVNRVGEPIVRTATRQAMRIMGHQFVMGRSIAEALKRSAKDAKLGYRFSFDMLGEAALTTADARHYMDAYHEGIKEISRSQDHEAESIFAAPGVSVKLSALHPRLSHFHEARVLDELTPGLTELAVHAAEAGVGLTIDAEEADRLEISLELFDRVYRNAALNNYEGFGVAVPTYQRRARDVLHYLTELAGEVGRRIPVRLVKGAYWDAEIKRAQEAGIRSFPVFTRKAHSDVSYLACTRQALDAGEALYLQFASHNAHTIAAVLHMAGDRRDFEFQRLHGMGEELYAEIIDPEKFDRPCRVYAPVGSHEDLLPYLVRRLLENGSNSSFVNRIVDEDIPVSDIVADPIETTREHECKPHPAILPASDMFLPERRNSRGINLADRHVTIELLGAMESAREKKWDVAAIVDGEHVGDKVVESINPADTEHVVGTCRFAGAEDVTRAIDVAVKGHVAWDRTPAGARSAALNRAADLFEENAAELISLCVTEGGRTIPDSISELREAVDFLRYYGAQAVRRFSEPYELPGPTGERNTIIMRGRGVFVCISPWNFPLAIFTGQVAAALAAGNAVLAKPASLTPIVAYRAIELMHQAGVPTDALHFVPASGSVIGKHAVADPRIAGVAFTGSTEVAQGINQTLAARNGPIGVLIAETGGQNAMFVDSSALPQQVVVDAVTSGFNSAGQRCSALRLVCVQEDVADKIESLLAGYMDELTIGDPAHLQTDVGPVIEAPSVETVDAHIERMKKDARILHQCTLDDATSSGTFCAPTLVGIDSVDTLTEEIFGPVLHVMRYKAKDLEKTVEAVNGTGFGLTMGLHSRIESRAQRVIDASRAGNIYVNRNMIGAVVGVQPFGGRGLSGTGPKAGGPNYLTRFGTEVTVSTNLAAVGGNASLLSMASE